MTAQRGGLLKQCGCAASRWPKCAHPWHLVTRFAGQRYSISLDRYTKPRGLDCPRTRGDAEKIAAGLVQAIETGVYQATPRLVAPAPRQDASEPDRLTFDRAVEKFVTTVLDPEMASLADEKGRYRKLGDVVLPEGVGRFGDVALVSITEDHVEAVFAAATAGKVAHTSRKYRRCLKRLLRWGVTKKHLVVSPVTEETVLRAGMGVMRTRRVRPDEEANLIAAAREGRSDAAARLAAIIVAALDLGLRLGELLALQWRDVLWDLHRVEVRAQEAGARKNRKSRQVPLTARVLDVLRQLETMAPTPHGWPATGYIFGDAIGGRVTKIRKAWVTCVLRAHGVKPAWSGTGLAREPRRAFRSIDLHFHDLRHTAALRWLERGYTLSTIARLLGHSNLDTLRVYLGMEQEDALAEAERINAALTGAEPPPVHAAVNRQYSGGRRRSLRLIGQEARSTKHQ